MTRRRYVVTERNADYYGPPRLELCEVLALSEDAALRGAREAYPEALEPLEATPKPRPRGRTRDSQRQRVYDSEHALPKSPTVGPTDDERRRRCLEPHRRRLGDIYAEVKRERLAAAQTYVNETLLQGWYRLAFGGPQEGPDGLPHPHRITVKQGRSKSWWRGGPTPRLITIADAEQRALILLHEMAHVEAPNHERHGPKWAAAFLYIVTKALGREMAEALADEYRRRGVKVDTEYLEALGRKGEDR